MATLKQSEHSEQVALVKWARLQGGDLRDARKIFAVPNGGARNAITGKRLKDEGVTPGVPDLFLPVARNGYHGLFVELKVKGGRATPAQAAMLHQLREDGYAAELCYGVDAGIETVERYLKGIL